MGRVDNEELAPRVWRLDNIADPPSALRRTADDRLRETHDPQEGQNCQVPGEGRLINQ